MENCQATEQDSQLDRGLFRRQKLLTTRTIPVTLKKGPSCHHFQMYMQNLALLFFSMLFIVIK